MSRESKIFTVFNKSEVSAKVKDYESFGWELLSINGLDVSMSRETQNPVYVHLVQYEHEYEVLEEKVFKLRNSIARLRYTPFNFLLALILLFIFVVPGLAYIAFKIYQKIKYDNNKAELEVEISSIQNQMKKICNDSRATFFSRKDS